MSDRASAQKSFNTLLEDYRLEVLPSVVDNWESITTEEQQAMAQMLHFFCGMHLIVNMAEHVSDTLKLFEQAHLNETQSEGEVAQSDSSGQPVRLLRS